MIKKFVSVYENSFRNQNELLIILNYFFKDI